MNNSRRRFFGLMAGAALAVVVGSQSIAARPPVQPVADLYTGIATSAELVDPITLLPVEFDLTLDLSNAKNLRLAGIAILDGTTYALKGTISASGQVSLLSTNPKLNLKGVFTDADPLIPSLKKIEGTYKFSKGGDRGTFLVEDAP